MVATAARLGRLRAAADVRRATIARIDETARVTIKPERRPGFIGDLKIIADSERPLDVALINELTNWLKSSDGFKDNVTRRCLSQHKVGFVLTSEALHSSAKVGELVLDFTCNGLMIGLEDGRGRVFTNSHFDSSRAQILSIVQRALPDDRELQQVR
jgi:hypothetical protein